MLKEFSRLDGAFVVSDREDRLRVPLPRTGCGGRRYSEGARRAPHGGRRDHPGHERDRDRPSESDGLVRAFKAGELVLEIDPEEY